MPDKPSFEYEIYERIESRNGEVILQVRQIYYTGRGEQEPYHEEDITRRMEGTIASSLLNLEDRVNYCRLHNDELFPEIIFSLDKYENQYKERPDDVITNRLLKYFRGVDSRIIKWYEEYKIEPPIIPKKWTGNKSEFAQFIVDTYNQDNKNSTKNYKSVTDATRKIFQQFTFDDPAWTCDKCHELVRKVN